MSVETISPDTHQSQPGVQAPGPKPDEYITLVEGRDGKFHVPETPQLGAGSRTGQDAAKGGDSATQAPEASTAETKDAEARYTDAQLLGGSFRVRRAVHEVGTQRIKAWQGLKAKVRNVVDTPAKVVKTFAYEKARVGHARKEKRLDTTTNARVLERRQKAVDVAKKHMDYRQEALKKHTATMEGRTKTVAENASQRRAELTAELKSRKENALARKAVRKQLRTEGATRSEARGIAAEMPHEHLDRVAKVAIVAETSTRLSDKAGRVEHKAKKRVERTERNIEKAKARIERHEDKGEAAGEAISKLHDTLLPEAKERLAVLRNELGHAEAGSETAERVHEALLLQQRKIDTYTADLKYWHGRAAHSIHKAGKAGARQTQLQGRLPGQKHAVGVATKQADRTWEVANIDKADLGDEVVISLHRDKN
jgi:hypothetical protein